MKLTTLTLLSVSVVGLGITGAMNFFRAMMSSFTVAAFSAILALGSEMSLAGDHGHPIAMISPADLVTAFRYVFAAAIVMLAAAALSVIAIEERARPPAQ